MTGSRRQLVLLAILVGGLGTWIWRGARDPGSGLGASAGGRAGGARAGGVQIVEVRLDALEGERAQFSPGRDPFGFARAPAPPPKPPPERPKPAPAEPPRQPQPRPAAAQPPRARPPAIDFVYLGSFGPGTRRIAVFSDTKEIYNAFAGDVVKQSFVVVDIGYESADIGFVGFPDEPAQRLAAGG